MRQPLRFGLIGCGRVAERYYLPALERIAAAQLVAVAEPSAERRALVASRYPTCSVYTSFDELVHAASIEAVIVTTPPATHPGIVASAVEAKKPVLVEKPLAPTMDGVQELAERVATTKACVQMGFNRRFWRPIQRLRDSFAQVHGTHPATAQLSMSSDVAAWDPISASPDAINDLGSHQMDLLRFVFASDIQSIRASWVESGALRMQARLVSGTTAECRVAHGKASHERIAVQCQGRRYRVHGSSDLVQPERGARRLALDGATAVLRRMRGRPPSLLSSFERQLVDFVDCVRSRRAPTPDIQDGIRVVEAVDAARASAQQGGEEVILSA